MSTRIIAGEFRGRRLRTPPGDSTRPTTDRVKEALFSALQARRGALQECKVLDLFAGSGGLGFEALSRGAELLVAVDSDPKVCRLLVNNANELGVVVHAKAQPVTKYLKSAPIPFDVVLIDPPYSVPTEEVEEVLSALLEGWLAPEADVVLERGSRSSAPSPPAGLRESGMKKYGETMLYYYEAGE